jgi:RNA polymerase sigma-B factor
VAPIRIRTSIAEGNRLSVTAPPGASAPASPPRERRPTADELLLARYARTRAPELRDRLVRRYLPLARYSASQYAGSSEPFDDLVQVACVGLLKALDRFDPSRGSAFTSFAMPTMSGELRRHFRDRGWSVRPPRDLQDHALTVERATGSLTAALGRSPTVDEVGERTGLAAEDVLEARQALASRHAVSFSMPVTGGNETVLSDRMGAEDPGFGAAEDRATLGRLMSHLCRRDREIVRLRFYEDLTQSEIAERVGLSQMHVSRLLRSALETLRQAAR